LGLVGIAEVERLPRMRQPQTKHVELDHLPGDRGGELTKIHLRLGRRRMSLRHQHLAAVGVDLSPQPRHQIPHRRLPDSRVFLLHQPLPNPAGGMPLLLGRRPVLDQPSSNKINIRAGRRSQPLRHLPSRRRGIRQRLTHRPPVHPMTLRQRPNRHPPIAGITSDTFKLLHSRSLLHTPGPS
jgi:hypothetical protein